MVRESRWTAKGGSSQCLTTCKSGNIFYLQNRRTRRHARLATYGESRAETHRLLEEKTTYRQPNLITPLTEGNDELQSLDEISPLLTHRTKSSFRTLQKRRERKRFSFLLLRDENSRQRQDHQLGDHRPFFSKSGSAEDAS